MTRREFQRLGLSAGAGLALAYPQQLLGSETVRLSSKNRRIPKTDTHMHLFGLDHLQYPWLKNAPEINKNFLPEDFIATSQRSNVGKIVFMESGSSSDSLKEVNWVIEQSRKDPRIKGIVASGQVDRGEITVPFIERLLATGWVKGLRGGINAAVLASGDFVSAMRLLASYELSFDLLIQPDLFKSISQAIDKAPDTVFILDHLGNPNIKDHDFDHWKKGIDELALRPNVNCKISGVLTRLGKDWTLKQIRPYVHYAIERFGFDRLVYGGDWPVVLRADSYLAWSRAFEKLTRPYSKDELRKLYHLNADRIYQLGD